MEYIVGRQYGEIYWYKRHAPDRWSRYLLGVDSPSDVGGCVMDVNRGGNIDFVAGGAWRRNSQDPDRPSERIVFDPDLTAVLDVVAADVDSHGHSEIITMSDRNNLRKRPRLCWIRLAEAPAPTLARSQHYTSVREFGT